MHVRITIFEGEAARIDELTAFVRGRGVAHVRSLEGNLGLTMTVDRDAGQCQVAVPFTSLSTLLESTGAVGPMRDVGDAIMTAREKPEVLDVVRDRSREVGSDDLTGYWQATARLGFEESSSAEELQTQLDRVTRELLPRPDVQTAECRTGGGSDGILILTCANRPDAETALAAAVAVCGNLGHRLVSTSTEQIVIDADALNQADYETSAEQQTG